MGFLRSLGFVSSTGLRFRDLVAMSDAAVEKAIRAILEAQTMQQVHEADLLNETAHSIIAQIRSSLKDIVDTEGKVTDEIAKAVVPLQNVIAKGLTFDSLRRRIGATLQGLGNGEDILEEINLAQEKIGEGRDTAASDFSRVSSYLKAEEILRHIKGRAGSLRQDVLSLIDRASKERRAIEKKVLPGTKLSKILEIELNIQNFEETLRRQKTGRKGSFKQFKTTISEKPKSIAERVVEKLIEVPLTEEQIKQMPEYVRPDEEQVKLSPRDIEQILSSGKEKEVLQKFSHMPALRDLILQMRAETLLRIIPMMEKGIREKIAALAEEDPLDAQRLLDRLEEIRQRG